MRIRLTLLLAAIAAIAGFAALNWSEFVRPVQLSWGFGTGEASLGLILLGLLALSWVAFLVGSAYLETHYQLAAHRHAKALEAQRVLADRAEASRFTELRTYLETQAAVAAQREASATGRLETTLQRELNGLRLTLDRIGAGMAGRYADGDARSPSTAPFTPTAPGGRTPH